MKIKLKSEWMGNMKGSIIDIKENQAKILMDRGNAVEVKEVKVPEVNKMVGSPEVNK